MVRARCSNSLARGEYGVGQLLPPCSRKQVVGFISRHSIRTHCALPLGIEPGIAGHKASTLPTVRLGPTFEGLAGGGGRWHEAMVRRAGVGAERAAAGAGPARQTRFR